MLKLERTARDQQLNIIINDKQRFLTPALLVSFAIAAAIHLLLLAIFHITPLTLRLNEQVYPPMIVQVDPLISPAAAVVAATASPKPAKDQLPNPPLLKPIIPSVPTFLAVRHLDNIKYQQPEINPFFYIEQDIYEIPMTSMKSQATIPEIAVIISGPLAALSVINSDLNTSFLLSKEEAEYRVVYSVIVDEVTGKIVWYVLKEPSRNSQLDKMAGSIIHEMQFAKNIAGFTTHGEIELHFRTHEAQES